MTDTESLNRELLLKYFPAVLQKLDHSLELPQVEILRTESVLIRNQEVIKFSRGDLSFLSQPPYKAEDKARAIISESLPEGDLLSDTVICIGISFVTLLRTLINERTKQIKSIIILEPDAHIFLEVLKKYDLSPVLRDIRVKLLVSSVANDCADALAQEIHPLRSRGWVLVLNPESYSFYRAFLEGFRERLTSVTTSLRLILNTTLRHSNRFVVNSFVNLANRPIAPDVSIFSGIATGLPVFLIAAGPSLERHLGVLQKYQKSCLTVCVGPAWKTLRAHSITPDFVVSIDPFDPNFTHFEGLAASTEWLVSDLANNCQIVENFGGKIVFCTSSDDQSEVFKELFGTKFTTVGTGGSVAHTAFNFCRLMGASKIVLIGQDLAYTGGISHAQGHTGRTSLAEDISTNPDAFREITAYGGTGKVTTNKQMDVYRLWYERLADKSDIVNATEGGARIDGVLEVPLCEMITKIADDADYPARLDEARRQIEEVSPTKLRRKGDVLKVSARQRRLLSELRAVRRKAEVCVKIMEELLNAADDGEPLKPLKERYNMAAKDLQAMSPALDLLLSTLLKNEVFVSKRNFSLFSEDERKHFETNFSLHTRLVTATKHAEELINLLVIKKG